MPKIHDFAVKLAQGQKWELPLLEKISRIRLKEHIAYLRDNGEFQRKGIDGILYAEQAKCDPKVRDYGAYKWKDILIETLSIIELNKKGWYYTSEADVIPYVWENPSRTNLIDGYFIFIQNQRFRQWFERYKDLHHEKRRVAHSQSNDHLWSTENYAVPIELFPYGSILRFNPHLSEIGKQMTLT